MRFFARYWYLVAAGILVGIAAVYFFRSASPSATAQRIPDEVDFNFHIRPILSDRCFKCHGPDATQRKADLRLDTEAGLYQALKENPDAHVIVSGEPNESELYRRLIADDTAQVMPPPYSRLTVTEYEKKLIKKWIGQGAKYQKHWAFISPKAPEIPEIESDWIANDIDRFILARMDEQSLEPNEKADKERLLKRVSFDLVGLPPSIELQERFLQDNSPDAYEKIVDELLASKHYGEKMAIHWLDVARYADSHGYQDDGMRTMWPWRDWVIHAFNQNYPYDRFLTWQLAGDLLPNPTKEMLLATGFNRNHKITQEGGVIDEEYRIEYVTDRTNTFGKAFLALTLECAKCHDHKYDPISQKDYYRTFAFFNQVNEKGLVGDIQLASLADPPRIVINDDDVKNILTFVNKKEKEPVQVMVMKDSSVIRPTHVLVRGVYDVLGEKVDFQVPQDIYPFDTTRLPKNRLGLAQWLTDKKHPLTARVFVNRIWQEFFGKGIVKTAGDFGMQGELPSHPELLDWLAVDFMTHNWDIKRLVKQIVMSSTYQQSSEVSNRKLTMDPENKFLSRAPRQRLPSELVKDHVLASSGLLVSEIGGPSVKPYQPDGIWESSTSGRGVLANYVQDHGEKLYRRGMYNFIKRTVPPPVMLMFDASNRDQCEVRRISTNTPLQALIMMNDPMVLEASRVLAERLTLEDLSPEQRIAKAFRLIVCRNAGEEEVRILKTLFDDEKKYYEAEPDRAKQKLEIGEYPHSELSDVASTAALMQVVTTMYNMDEAITR
ncbi:MAG TPA: PSD1 and planctomycete cytochrome C domain-containing protein [Chryseosolibacter sp.]|nr:PSD1 and planctomycete cytochrome C domain-containing protein [Chryseosolibacter sp.]